MTVRMVRTVEELRTLPVGSVVVEGTAGTGVEQGPFGIPVMPGVFHRFPNGWHVVAGHGARDVPLPATVLTPAIDPDDEALVERVALAAKEAWLTLPHTRGGNQELWLGIARAALKAVTQ